MKSFLFLLVLVITISSLLSGLQMISHPEGETLNLQVSLLSGTPFKNFKVPGLILTSFVGSINLIAVLYTIQVHPQRFIWSIAGGTLICIWSLVEIVFIYPFWQHFISLTLGLIIIVVAYHLKK